MSIPLNKNLWIKVKKLADETYKAPSAYKSGFMVKKYKELGGKFTGEKDTGAGLTRWFAEDWKNQNNKVGYQKVGDIYRPTIRVNSRTPKTWKELTDAQIAKAKKEKAKNKRVKKF